MVSGDGYFVAVNGEEQHAMWPAGLTLPLGWRRDSATMSRSDCLSAITADWQDIAPVSVREAGPGVSPATDGPPFVHQEFGRTACLQPDKLAVASEVTQLTYRELADSAYQVAHYLRALGVGPEALVGVHLERGVEAIRCVLAVLAAGGGYLPLDPALPSTRLVQMCEQARPRVIVTQATHACQEVLETGTTLVSIAELTRAAASEPVTAPPVSLRMDNIAYAIYTSGSTGRPKAVAVSHRSLACLIPEISRKYGISPHDRVLQLAALGFDTSMEQILVTLLGGATLLLPPPGVVAPTDLLGYLAAERATVIDLTPAYWHQLLALTEPRDVRLKHLRLMITGGDRANRDDCAAAMLAAPGARLVNAYGLTETTITSTLYEAGELPPGRTVPAGRPLPHAQVLVLDENLDQVPAGAAGEVYIGGPGVARGYLGQPGLTAERFLPNPHATVPGSRMYRTGDLGLWLAARDAGRDLEVIGRVDQQLKIRGFRVEPAEIESTLVTHPGIGHAAVVAHELGPGHVQLTAYYARRGDTQDQLPGETLRAFLADRLPSFMVPAEYIPLHQIPRKPDGEVDRRALAYPALETGGGPDRERYTPTQAGLSHLWAKILHTDRVSLDDDFFARGGNSLLAAEMLAHARVMFGIGARYVRPLTRCLLRDPTLRGFSEATQAARAGRLDADGADQRVDFAREVERDVPVRLDANDPPQWQRPRQILLTGATGFFGVHLLRELLDTTTAQVNCLVRARDAKHGLRRIARAAERYAIGDLAMDRVTAVVGDLAEPSLGLPAGRFAELARFVDVIHHTGALVNFIYPYTELRPVNVAGTQELIRLAGLHRGIPVHYVSSTAVLAGFGVMGVREVTEHTPLAYADHLGVGYVETKFVAEQLLRRAGAAGLPVAIYRPLDIVGDLRSGAWNTATEISALIRFITDTGFAPDIDLPLDFVPADVCAAAIAHISTHAEASGITYHISSSKYALLGSLVARLRHYGYSVEVIPYGEWLDELLKHAASHPGHPMTPFVPLFVEHCAESELTVAEMYLEHIFPAYARTHTERALNGSGIVLPPVSDELIDRSIARLMTTGYLRDPR